MIFTMQTMTDTILQTMLVPGFILVAAVVLSMPIIMLGFSLSTKSASHNKAGIKVFRNSMLGLLFVVGVALL